MKDYYSEIDRALTRLERGLYTGMTQALANICTEVIMNGVSGSAIIDQAKAKFYRVFPYMKK